MNTGCLLADTKGLGKTVQLIAFIESIRLHYALNTETTHSSDNKIVLVACALSSLDQWMHEFHRWAPRIRVIVFHERSNLNSMCYRDMYADVLKHQQRRDFIAVITTYTMLKNNEPYLLDNVQYELAVLDNGDAIKNSNNQASQTCRKIKVKRGVRVLVVDKPLQNSLADIWSLFNCIRPGYLGTTKQFNFEFIRPIRMCRLFHCTEQQYQYGIECCKELKKLISPFVLRRTKEQVKTELRKFIQNRNEKILFCILTNTQIDMYERCLIKFNALRNNKSRNRVKVVSPFKYVNCLARICDHPDLYINEKANTDLELSFADSCKLNVLQSVLVDWHKDKLSNKVLLFARDVQFVDIVDRYLSSLDENFKYLRIDGSMSRKMRRAAIDRFNDLRRRVFLLLLTTDMSSQAFDLAKANRVVLVDANFSLYGDRESGERCCRIGQAKEVTVYRLICKGTVEEKIYKRYYELFGGERSVNGSGVGRAAEINHALVNYCSQVKSATRFRLLQFYCCAELEHVFVYRSVLKLTF